MIYLTGDTHGGSDVKKLLNKQTVNKIQKDDYLIICGDFGFIWDRKKEARKEKTWLDWFADRPFTTLFVDGNHECFPRLNEYPLEDWHGGKVNVIRPNLFHLKRGYIYEIEGQKFFTMGGAASHDRGPAVGNTKSVIGKYWWPEEIPSEEEFLFAKKNLEYADYKVDYIITHCLSTELQEIAVGDKFKADDLTTFLQSVQENVTFKHWYCGHYHMDQDITDKVTVLFNKIIALDDTIHTSTPMLGNPTYHKGDQVFFVQEGTTLYGTILNVYPWGNMKDHSMPIYDITADSQTYRTIKESDVKGVQK